jgi:DNA-binding beta-propeller fold protein YncE
LRVFFIFLCFVRSDSLSLFPLPSRQLQGEWQRTVGSKGDQLVQFQYPRDLALTPDEAFLLVVDWGNHRVTVLRASDGTWVRQLTGPPGTLPNPWGVAVVPSTGEVLVSDWNRHQVVRFLSIDDDTVVGTLGTGQGSGPTQFNWPSGLAVLDGPHRPLVCFILFSFIF